MEHHEPIITEHSPFFQPYVTPEEAARGRAEHRRNVEAASREAAEREMAYARALSEPPRIHAQEPPPHKAPVIPFDVAEIDEKIFERGIAIDRARLHSLGKERFEDLILLDGRARQWQRIIGTNTDLTSWERVRFAFDVVGSFDVAGIPPRKTAEIAAGMGKDREEARTIGGFHDLWKLFERQPQAVRSLYPFLDAFARLAFGQSNARKTFRRWPVAEPFFLWR
jgi:hypothetical protein